MTRATVLKCMAQHSLALTSDLVARGEAEFNHPVMQLLLAKGVHLSENAQEVLETIIANGKIESVQVQSEERG
eukprot:CAMPEP_0201282828 /NCGR_PEP_ID=MMETSP1317-20130820/6790_1 /ASSEMBLY_ACC=CAM_ASM_000770 /TAXON_ID=187299 /ORGANISM="Undescribed Undescribed, Strain Undescribed" /LENGTH=72 /DNA_ID=CAMNT_0047596869 /DNA_START=1153 /DNA_END=1371 /DNA_ORIENTATION=+